MLLTKKDIAVKHERVYKEVTLPSPDPTLNPDKVTVRIRSMFQSEYFELINSLYDKDGERIESRWKVLRHLEIAFCWVDADGKRELSDEDIFCDWYKRLHPAFVSELLTAVRATNGAGVFDNVDASKKNSEETTDSECFTVLPSDAVTPPPEIVSTL